MSKKSSIDSIFDVISTIWFIKYGLPWVIVIIAVLFGIAYINSGIVKSDYDSSTTMFTTSFASEITNIVESNLDKSNYSVSYDNTSDFYDIEINYIVNNKQLSVEEYNLLVKNEITRVYNEIKYKKVINNGLFAENRDVKKQTIKFEFSLDSNYNTDFAYAVLEYNIDSKWDNSYNELMNKNLVTQEDFDKAFEAYSKNT